MEPDIAEQRQQAHALLDMLEGQKVAAVRTLLEVMVEPLSQHLNALPVEDEELSPETVAAIEMASGAMERGEAIPHEEILREFGVKE
ncbi:MAG: hypothetical protein WAM71_08470 [Candidatus Korobacteraceae bacterium]